MEIKDLRPNQGNVDLVLEVVDKEEPRKFEKFGKRGTVCNAKVKDNTGEVKLTLWNEDVDKISPGDRIHLQNGWCSEYKGEKQLSAGKFGKIEILEAATQKTLFTNDPGMLKQPEIDEEEPETFDDEEELVE